MDVHFEGDGNLMQVQDGAVDATMTVTVTLTMRLALTLTKTGLRRLKKAKSRREPGPTYR